MKTREYKRKLKSLKAKVLELVLEDFSGCWTKEDASALGYAVKFIQGLTINEDGTINYDTGIDKYNSAMWSAVRTLDRIKQDYNKPIMDKNLLEELKKSIEKGEQLSYGEISFLQRHQKEIKKYYPNDADLYQWANIPEEEFGK